MTEQSAAERAFEAQYGSEEDEDNVGHYEVWCLQRGAYVWGYRAAEAASHDEVLTLQRQIAELEAGTQYQPYVDRIEELEAALRDVLTEIPNCWCDAAYTDRGRFDPSCIFHHIGEEEVSQAQAALAEQEDAGAR